MPLRGPADCRFCGAKMRRRRYWGLWNLVNCKCGASYECVRQNPLTFSVRGSIDGRKP